MTVCDPVRRAENCENCAAPYVQPFTSRWWAILWWVDDRVHRTQCGRSVGVWEWRLHGLICDAVDRKLCRIGDDRMQLSGVST